MLIANIITKCMLITIAVIILQIILCLILQQLLTRKNNMDNSLRNAFIGAIVTIAVAFIGAWIQLNSRIAVLEVQVANDHATLQETASNMKEVKTILAVPPNELLLFHQSYR